MTDVWHPFTQLRGFTARGRVVGAEGAWLHLDDGRRVLDGISSWWVTSHGHAHPRIAAAIAAQSRAFDQVILADFTHGPAADLSAALARVLPGDLDHAFFSDDGSTSVEVALKLAMQGQAQRGAHRRRIVALEGGYHGDTVGAMSVSARGAFTNPFAPMLFDVDFLPWDDADAAEAWLDAHGSDVAAVIVEPLVQGAAGMRFSSVDFLRRLAAATHAAGAWLIADEVFTGFGRTGTMFACERAGVVPDIVCLSKGLTGGSIALGATVCRAHVFEAFLDDHDRSRAFLHGHSYTGSPIACAAALAALSLYDEEHTLGRITALERAFHDARGALDQPGVSGVRVRGGILAFEVAGGPGGYFDPIGRRVCDRAFAEGLYVRPLGDTVYLLPPYCTTSDEARWAVDVLARSVARERLLGAS